MNNQELINKIKQLKKIEPNNNWLNSTRYELLSEMTAKPEKLGFWGWLKELQSLAIVISIGVFVSIGPWAAISASKDSMPGDLLYSLKKAAENVQFTMAAENNKTTLQVEFAARRFEELNKITDSSDSEKAKEVVNEFKNNLVDAGLYANKISKDRAIAVVKQTKKLIDKIEKSENNSPEIQSDLEEAKKAIREINSQILAVLASDSDDESGDTATSTTEFLDKETLIFFLNNDNATITPTTTPKDGVDLIDEVE